MLMLLLPLYCSSVWQNTHHCCKAPPRAPASLYCACVCACVWLYFEESRRERVRGKKRASDVSGLVRIEGGIRICLALIWHRYLCPRRCFLSLSCHSLSTLDNVSLDYEIGRSARSLPLFLPDTRLSLKTLSLSLSLSVLSLSLSSTLPPLMHLMPI